MRGNPKSCCIFVLILRAGVLPKSFLGYSYVLKWLQGSRCLKNRNI